MRPRWLLWSVVALVPLAPAHALAQAWTPPKGEFSFNFV